MNVLFTASSTTAPLLLPCFLATASIVSRVKGVIRTDNVSRRSLPLDFRPAPFLRPPRGEPVFPKFMTEVQRHGFDFQDWVIQTFFVSHVGEYTGKWDVPADFNTLEIVPESFRHLPVSIKTCKYKSPIGFGDAIRQFNLSEDFLLIVGFWRQDGPSKNFVAAEAVKVTATYWKSLFGPISKEVLQQLDRIVKDTGIHYKTRQLSAKNSKRSFPFTEARMVLNPKIDSKEQRRLQCSLPFKEFWSIVGKEHYADVHCTLFGKPVPNPFNSGPRTFRKTH